MRQILELDLLYAPFEYLESEKRHYASFELSSGERVYFGGIIDRVDKMELGYRVVDYKTGKEKIHMTKWDLLLDSEYKAILQTLIYCAFLTESGVPKDEIYPAIYMLRGDYGLMVKGQGYDPLVHLPSQEDGKPKAALLSYKEAEAPFLELFVHQVLDELYDSTRPFIQTTDEKNCQYCPFALSCGR